MRLLIVLIGLLTLQPQPPKATSSSLQTAFQLVLDSPQAKAAYANHGLTSPLRIYDTVLVEGLDLGQFGTRAEVLRADESFFSSPGFVRFDLVESKSISDLVVVATIVGPAQPEDEATQVTVHLRRSDSGWGLAS